MDDRMKAELDSLFAARDTRRTRESQAAVERDQREQQFVARFATAVETVVRPTFEELATYLKDRGIGARITVRPAETDGHGHAMTPRVTLTVLISDRPEESHVDRDYPHLTVICEPLTERVRFHQSTLVAGRGGQSGTEGETKLEGLTREELQRRAAALLQAVVR